VVDAAWTAFSSRTSMAAFAILVSTRGAVADDRLLELGNSLSALGRRLGEGLDTARASEVGNLIWATLRGLAVAQLISPTPLDSSNDRQVLVDAIIAYITSHSSECGS
jgi:hypothetical protein